MPIPPNIASASTGSALGGYTEAVSIATGLIVNYAFASSIKSDQKRFEKEMDFGKIKVVDPNNKNKNFKIVDPEDE